MSARWATGGDLREAHTRREAERQRLRTLARPQERELLGRRCGCDLPVHVRAAALVACIACGAIWHRSGSNATRTELEHLAAAVRRGVHPQLEGS